MSSMHSSTSTLSSRKHQIPSIKKKEVLDEQLADWWSSTVLGDSAFVSEDSIASLGWEFETDEIPTTIEIVPETSTHSKKSRKKKTKKSRPTKVTAQAA
mmetsp:Transcript_18347/g.45554  ORF Transcript_18347/g.45554 Transcript_18347/m.45554 type:complete len:99 (-) Transcript_18347:412-708(-)|eukprot:CAMPEP_0116094642 /NCGR_PEP_ID=MMETSP0327-20121206/9242_1 /TAXON_ID=44447 /ORGANISM="Pseudo-nitzschia delicatissima, Strain B596" /LENGTH=98 /DNA_ID=CAMNT_0003586263 /DNA_START=141 /DNA_END=437 /DNA_ORIENTATION=-